MKILKILKPMSEAIPYCEDPFVYSRRKTRVVHIGDIALGGDYPIRVQSMTVADTRDIRATVTQIRDLAEVGCEIVRVTVPSLVEAECLREIRSLMQRESIKVPLVADIHFTPNAALKAVEFVEKVRINPGNYADRKRMELREYSDNEYLQELERLETQFKPLVLKAKEYGVALRIGTNHGSLSDRVMNRYGDSPKGMVESALEFVRICQRFDFHDIVLSMKSSNPLVMVQAYRLLAARMDQEGMDYPFHLGVTEAGDGEDGRIKSAIGIGSLMEDGIGDTIRVSLTEDPLEEVPFGFQLVRKYNERAELTRKHEEQNVPMGKVTDNQPSLIDPRTPYEYSRRSSKRVSVGGIEVGGGNPVQVELSIRGEISDHKAVLKEIIHLSNPWDPDALKADIIEIPFKSDSDVEPFMALKKALDVRSLYPTLAGGFHPEFKLLSEVLPELDKVNMNVDQSFKKESIRSIIQLCRAFKVPIQWNVNLDFKGVPGLGKNQNGFSSLVQVFEDISHLCDKENFTGYFFSLNYPDFIEGNRLLVALLAELKNEVPLALRYVSMHGQERCLLDISVLLGSLLSDGIGDLIHISGNQDGGDFLRLSFNLLQAARLRLSKTEFISCPSCGRTLFNLQTTTERIKSKMSHLKGVKIAIMGCIVNGPGEMADADFGYVGSGPKKVDLYVGKDRVQKNIPEEEADERLIDLIKAEGKWVDA